MSWVEQSMHHISHAVERPQRFLIPLHCLRLHVAFAAYTRSMERPPVRCQRSLLIV
jgi:hypothetical protein